MADVGHNSGQPLSDEQKAKLEVENGLQQFDRALQVIEEYIDPERPFNLRPYLIRELQAIAVDGGLLDTGNPGDWRTTSVEITKSKHSPPPPHTVEMHVVELCEYINNNLHERTPLHLASYIMWRLNWIHPFPDGNGRTSRILSYILLNVKLGYILPGNPSIPQQIVERRSLYLDALEAADTSILDGGELNLSQMEKMLRAMLANQLVSVVDSADRAG